MCYYEFNLLSQGAVNFDQNGTRNAAPAKVFKYFGGNSSRNIICGETPGKPVPIANRTLKMMTLTCH